MFTLSSRVALYAFSISVRSESFDEPNDQGNLSFSGLRESGILPGPSVPLGPGGILVMPIVPVSMLIASVRPVALRVEVQVEGRVCPGPGGGALITVSSSAGNVTWVRLTPLAPAVICGVD